MKKTIAILAFALCVTTLSSFAQTNFKQYKIGHIFNISVPDYMTKTTGLNSAATVQYKNAIKDVYSFVIEDNKEELTIAQLNYTSINEFYDEFIKDFLKGEENLKISKPVYQKKVDANFVECDVTYLDKDAKTEIYYLIGIVETKSTYYKVLSWTVAENKDKFKADFQKILYSLKD